jgi:hypothetical protein
MIGRLCSLFGTTPNRDIFSFKENGIKRAVDPLVVRRELDKANPAWLSLMLLLDTSTLRGTGASIEMVAEAKRQADDIDK